jgi:hypothetical protein
LFHIARFAPFAKGKLNTGVENWWRDSLSCELEINAYDMDEEKR